MKKKIITAITIVTLMGVSFGVGATQFSRIETKEVIPKGYIAIEDCIPISDISIAYTDKYDYITFELNDVSKQLDDVNGVDYKSICDRINSNYTYIKENEDFVEYKTKDGYVYKIEK